VSAGAIVAALAFGIGLAMSSLMSNLMGGIVILSYKHVKVGDFVQCGG
jgi:small-conductance mechanosensitive channel